MDALALLAPAPVGLLALELPRTVSTLELHTWDTQTETRGRDAPELPPATRGARSDRSWRGVVSNAALLRPSRSRTASCRASLSASSRASLSDSRPCLAASSAARLGTFIHAVSESPNSGKELHSRSSAIGKCNNTERACAVASFYADP